MSAKKYFSRVFAAITNTTPAASLTPGVFPVINVIDKSTLLQQPDFDAMVEACKIQLDSHVASAWLKGTWNIVKNQPESVGFPIVILDDPDQAGALGYHTESPGGKMWGRVFVKPVLNNKGSMLHGSMSVSTVLSHEIIEAYCDPNVNLWANRSDGMLIAYEACDPVENDSYEITIKNGSKVSVSNFVFPAWFDPQSPQGAKYDYMGKTIKPFSMSPGGYLVTMNPKNGQVKNIFGSKESAAAHALRQSPHPAARSVRKSLSKKDGHFLEE